MDQQKSNISMALFVSYQIFCNLKTENKQIVFQYLVPLWKCLQEVIESLKLRVKLKTWATKSH